MTLDYHSAGYDETRTIGFGARAGVIVVDFQRAFTDPAFPLGRAPHVQRAVENTAKLLAVVRRAGAPVAQSFSAYSSARDMPHWKVAPPSGAESPFFIGGGGAELDPRTYAADYDTVYWKRAPSLFFGTSAAQFFVRERVDTLVVTGCTTSGCVRASIVDAFSHGFRVIVAEPCCGDIEAAAHRANLDDVGRRYADIVDLETCLRHFEAISAAA